MPVKAEAALYLKKNKAFWWHTWKELMEHYCAEAHRLRNLYEMLTSSQRVSGSMIYCQPSKKLA